MKSPSHTRIPDRLHDSAPDPSLLLLCTREAVLIGCVFGLLLHPVAGPGLSPWLPETQSNPHGCGQPAGARGRGACPLALLDSQIEIQVNVNKGFQNNVITYFTQNYILKMLIFRDFRRYRIQPFGTSACRIVFFGFTAQTPSFHHTGLCFPGSLMPSASACPQPPAVLHTPPGRKGRLLGLLP